MITFLLGFTLGTIFGVTGLVYVAMISTTQTNRKEQRYDDKE